MRDAPILSPLPTGRWRRDLSPIVDDMGGEPLNVHKLMAHNPALLQAWWAFRNHSVQGGTLGPRRGELVILRSAVHLGVWYEWASHVDRALRIGMTPDEVDGLLAPQLSGAWAADETALISAVDQLYSDHALTGEIRAALAAHFSPDQVLDLIAIHGMYVILGCMIQSAEIDLDPAVALRIAGIVDRDEFEQAVQAFRSATASHGGSG